MACVLNKRIVYGKRVLFVGLNFLLFIEQQIICISFDSMENMSIVCVIFNQKRLPPLFYDSNLSFI